MGNRLEGKVAIVTGGTRGIGKGIATAFVTEGAKVVFTGRDLTAGAALEDELGKNARFMPVNVAKEIEVAKMVKATSDYFGGLNCLVSNAGGGLHAGAVTDMNTDKFWGELSCACRRRGLWHETRCDRDGEAWRWQHHQYLFNCREQS